MSDDVVYPDDVPPPGIELDRREGDGWWLTFPDGETVQVVRHEMDGGFRIADMLACGYLQIRYLGWTVENWSTGGPRGGYTPNLVPAIFLVEES